MGFVGCIWKIINNKYMYDFKNFFKVVNFFEGCILVFIVCLFCNNNGYCELYLDKESVCVCDVG